MKEVSPNRSGRLISVERLIARLGLEEYKAAAPYEEKNITYGKVKLMLSQNIGAPSVPCVSVGDKVTVGDKIADAAPDKLSVDLHASISGEVAEVTERYIIIKA
jgi:Na+-translocating ferredoxin:NAD+ oxidoreductase RnfC subunit